MTTNSYTLFMVSSILGLLTTALTIFSIFFDYDKEEPVRLSKWGRVAIAFTLFLAIAAGYIKYVEYKATEVSKIKSDSLQNSLISKNDILASILTTFRTNALTELDTINKKVKNSLETLGSVSVNIDDASKKTSKIASSIDSSMQFQVLAQKNITSQQEAIRNQILRGYFPLQPLTLLYEIEVSMDLPGLNHYTKRLEKTIAEDLRQSRRLFGTRETMDDLSSETGTIFIPTNNDKWRPTKDDSAGFRLLIDLTRFSFTDPQDESVVLEFSPNRNKTNEIIESQVVELTADFSKRIYTQLVTTTNPFRSGTDMQSLSSIDLIGRRMTWRSSTYQSDNKVLVLRKFALKFGKEDPYNEAVRWILIQPGTSSITIQANTVGVEKYLKKIGSAEALGVKSN